MPMNQIIQERRRALGLTQEQVAEHLKVSTPAVSKWETGATSPDISLLVPLARLLRIDLNTLLCFREDMSRQEIGRFCGEITELVRTEGLASGFASAEEKLREFPNSETLLHSLTFQLDGLLAMSGLSGEETRPYDAILTGWYRRLSESRDSAIRGSADYMIASRCIRDGDCDRAQEILEHMPDREELFAGMADTRLLRINLWLRRGETERAVRELQGALLPALNRVQMLLYKLIDAALADGELPAAKEIAEKSSRLAVLFDLWEYNAWVAPLQVSLAEKDAGTCIALLRKLLAAMCTPWDTCRSPLFDRIAGTSDPKQMLPAVLSEMERDTSAYGFLHGDPAFRALVSEYRALL